MATIDRVQVEVEATAKGTSAVFSQLEKQLSTIKSALDGIDVSKLTAISKKSNSITVDTSGMTKAEKEVRDTIDNIQVKIAQLNSLKNAALSGDSSSLTSFNRKIISIQGEIDGLAERLKQLGNNKTGVSIDTDTFQSFRTELAEIEKNLQDTKTNVNQTFSEINQNKVDLDTGDTSSHLSDIADKAKEAASSLWSMTKSGIKSGFSALKSSLSKIKDTLTSIGTKASNTASTGFSKILKYGFGIRSLYVLFRRLRTAVKDSFTELQNSGAYFETTKANVEALKNSLTTLKYQFGAAFEPIFNTVAPALETLINYLVAVMNTISAFIAKLTGKSTYSKAVVATAEIADNTSSAAGSAAELNKQLQGFDELNNLDLDSGSSGGSSGGSSSDSSDITYVEESVDSALTSFWNSLADAITSGDWYTVGSLISTELTDALNSINWDSIFASASSFGTDLAQFLNGLITDDLFSAVGTTIANAIKTALIAAISFADTENGGFDWEGLGTAIASGINAFVEANPLSLLVTAFNLWANGILTTLITAIQNISWKDIAQNIADAIGKIDAKGISWKLGTLATSIANALNDLVSNKETWTNLGTKIADGINGFFEGFDGSSVAHLLNNLISGLTSMITTALKKISWSEIGKDIVGFIGNLDLGSIALIIGGVYLATAAKTFLATTIPALLSTEVMSIVGGIGSVSAGTVAISVIAAASIGWKIGTKLYESASGHEVQQGFIEEITDIWNGFTEDKVSFNLLDFIEFTVEDADGWYGTYRDWVYDLVDYISEDFSKLKTSIKTAWQSVWYGNGTGVQQGYNGAPSEAYAYINSQQSSDLDELGANLWQGIYDGFETAMMYTNPLLGPIIWLKNKIPEWWGDEFEEHSPAQAVKPLGENLWLGIYYGFKEAMETYSISDLINDLSLDILGTGTEKTGSTAQGNFNRNTDKTHSNRTTSGSNVSTFTYKIKTTLTGAAQSKTDVDNLKTSFSNLTTESSKSTDATYTAKVGGQINQINDLDEWKSTFTGLRNKWNGKTATLKAEENGLANGNVSRWISTFDGWKTKWTDKPATLQVKEDGLANGKAQSWVNTLINTIHKQWIDKDAFLYTKESGINEFTKSGGWMDKLKKIQELWQGIGVNRTATFTSNTAGNIGSAENMQKTADAMNNLNNSFNGDKSASFTASYSGPGADEMGSYAGGIDALNTSFSNASSQDLTYTVSTSLDMSSLDDFSSKLADKIKKASSKVKLSISMSANGGIISGGVLTNIPQYAGGTLDAGSIFVAGEAGPEVMGHINGRTEILNRSQMASIMNNAYLNAMAQFGNRMLASPESLMTRTNGYQGYSSSYDGNYTLLLEQNELLRQQNTLLAAIRDKDTSVNSRDVFNAMRSESESYFNRTGNSPFLF